jgi:ribosomal-protein-alanine N-acetyltransferase
MSGFDPTRSQIEIGYLFLKDFWGKGYATEAVQELLKWGSINL